MFKHFLKIFFFSFLTLQFFAPHASLWAEETASKPKTIVVGVSPGAHEEVMEFVKNLAAKQGLNVKIVTFNDYILPNAALAEGDLDLNCYQHEPFLTEQVKSRGYDLVSIGKNLLMPMALYSKKIKNLNELKDKAQIAIPNDPTNGGRALILLEKQGLVTLKKDTGHTPSVLDIGNNPKKLKIIEIEAPQIPRMLQDVDAAVINTEFALLAGLDPAKDSLAIESTDSPYVNIFATRAKDKNNKDILKFIQIYQSPETEEFIKTRFGNSIIPSWK